jgi:phosphatidylglycerol---prolipoprotein diacylglyceryl transferase
LPEKLWAYDYPNNVNGVGQPMMDGVVFEGYGTHLVPPVFPTPLYETTMAVLIFAGLWYFRSRLKTPGMIMGLYLVFNGLERFLIEQIRVNNTFPLLGMKVTQAEVIALLFLTGGIIMIWLVKRKKRLVTPSAE